MSPQGWAGLVVVVLAIAGVGLIVRLAKKSERREVEGEQSDATIRWHEQVAKGLMAPRRSRADRHQRMREARLRREDAAAQAAAKRRGDH